MIPTGPLVDVAATLIGGLLGATFGHKIPERIRTALPLTFGAASMAMGISMINKMATLPAVVLALIIGAIIGELLSFETKIEGFAARIQPSIQRFFGSESQGDNEQVMVLFVGILVLFSASGTGIFGALNEGMTHDVSILISKAFLDFFTAAIFGASIGYLVVTTVVPQFIILIGLYYLSGFVLPLTTDILIQDFSACGGIIMLVTGFRICGIKKFPIANLLPALLLVMFCTHYWRLFF